MRNLFFSAIILFFLISCAKQVIKPPEPPESAPPPAQASAPSASSGTSDNWDKIGPSLKYCDWQGFFKVLNNVVTELEKDPKKVISAGGTHYPAGLMIDRLKVLRDLSDSDNDNEKMLRLMADNFNMVEISNDEQKAFYTAYYVPEFEARTKADDVFRYPIYSLPKDLITLKLFPLGPDFRTLVFRGRLDEKGRLIQYYSRKEINGEKILSDRKLELAYLKDPLDVLILQIQGSGRLVFENGEVQLAAYAGKNGHPYNSIGRYMGENGMLPMEEVSWKNIKGFLNDHPEKLEEVLYSNPSYVFFALKKTGAVAGSLGVPLTPLHSIAVDNRFIPPLTFCLINLRKPVIGEDGSVKAFAPLAELAFAMDEGSAILGPARVDIFLGSGEDAEKLAGTLKGEGELYILVPKEKPLNQPLKEN
jgi:membrane-bound lytic murein transglycosylase A